MTREEARQQMGYEHIASITYDLRRGRLSLHRNGEITAASLARNKARREAAAVRTALFLTEGPLTAKQKAILSERPARTKANA